eukprot:CAMPEP_0171120728 /NCGR_PEP_ID=MMETSP0766_2-20121228/100477_1 /TAXON_ID=439317 /ORGANISM="Gambierdiscus australes, Strain CAWD 149" /LENGTH=56 /DNA_ID=CAMNT_0011583477 /DNA_START=390 /DNA_END=558 /DNA_ORIENTATION=+
MRAAVSVREDEEPLTTTSSPAGTPGSMKSPFSTSGSRKVTLFFLGTGVGPTLSSLA